MFERDDQSHASKPLRICMLVPYDITERGGVKHHAIELSDALRRLGDEVIMLAASSVEIDEPLLRGLPGIVNVRSNGSDNRMGLLVSPPAIWRFFRRHRFDVVHVHEPQLPLLPYWAAYLAPSLPRICTFHSYAEAPPPRLTRAAKLWAMLQVPFYDRGIAVSEPAARYAGLSWKRPVCVIPNGVSTEMFCPPPERARADGPLRLLFVGRLSDERKGLSHLLEAYRQLRASGLDVALDLVGENAGAAPPPALPGLSYHGSLPLPELVQRYQHADIVIAPSTGQESFGIVLLEAMACGKPLVCSAIEGYLQVADPSGAIIVQPADGGAIARAVQELGADPARRAQMGRLNRRVALGYDWSALAPRIRNEYLAAVAARQGRRAPAVQGRSSQGPASRSASIWSPLKTDASAPL